MKNSETGVGSTAVWTFSGNSSILAGTDFPNIDIYAKKMPSETDVAPKAIKWDGWMGLGRKSLGRLC